MEFLLSSIVWFLHIGIIIVMAPFYSGIKNSIEARVFEGKKVPIGFRWSELISDLYTFKAHKEERVSGFVFLSFVFMVAAWAFLPSFSTGMVTASFSSLMVMGSLVVISRIVGVWAISAKVSNALRFSIALFLKECIWIVIVVFIISVVLMNLYSTDVFVWCLEKMKGKVVLSDEFTFQALMVLSLGVLSLQGEGAFARSHEKEIVESLPLPDFFYMSYRMDLEQLFWVTLMGDILFAPTLLGDPSGFSGIIFIQWCVWFVGAVVFFVLRTLLAACCFPVLKKIFGQFNVASQYNGYIAALIGGITLLLSWGIR